MLVGAEANVSGGDGEDFLSTFYIRTCHKPGVVGIHLPPFSDTHGYHQWSMKEEAYVENKLQYLNDSFKQFLIKNEATTTKIGCKKAAKHYTPRG